MTFASQVSLRSAWLVVGLLIPVALLNYLDRQMLSSMKFSVMADLPDIGNDANWGRMLGQFKWVYAIFSPLGGYIADRFSRRLTICGSLFVWSAITWGTSQVHTFQELMLARSLMGVSEAFYIPAALALITDYHLGPTRSRAVGFHQTSIYLGVIIGGFSGYAADIPSMGWRFAFIACGLTGILYTLPLTFLLRDAPKDMLTQKATTVPRSNPIWELMTNKSFLLLIVCFTLPAQAAWVIRDWMPAILKQQFHIGQGKAGVSATLYWQSAAIIGAFLGGWLADRLVRTHLRGRIYVSALGMAFIIPALFGTGNAGSLEVAVFFLALFGLGWGFFDVNNMPILCQIVRPDLRATGYGLMNMVSISCGGFADWGFGLLRDRGYPLNIIFGAFACSALISIVLILLIRPRSTNS
ncbi:MAG: MFS transporter [Pedosphaera sp.]|nr:MFS transporter [Pedosphaera sp.]